MKTQLTGILNAWLTPYTALSDLGSPAALGLLVYSNNEMAAEGWTLVGVASLAVEINDHADIVEAKIAALRAEEAAVEAKAAQHKWRINDEISKLLAIGYTPAEYEFVGAAPADDDLPF